MVYTFKMWSTEWWYGLMYGICGSYRIQHVVVSRVGNKMLSNIDGTVTAILCASSGFHKLLFFNGSDGEIWW